MQETVDTPGRLDAVEELLAEHAGHEGIVELGDGRPVEASAQMPNPGRLKATVTVARQRAIDEAGRALAVMIGGPALRTGHSRVRAPDVAVAEESERRSRDVLVAPPPIAVQILSESPMKTDAVSKPEAYRAIASLADDRILAPPQTPVTHHARPKEGMVAPVMARSGRLALAAGSRATGARSGRARPDAGLD